ncbi:hypothetical protein TRIP_B350041 [uncultured Desulfatiglans sp.]|nr:hypothetical protein TRIP_B350041 [uncultured Desulfatiglans sp.]
MLLQGSIDRPLSGGGMQPAVGEGIAPVTGLALQVGEIDELAQGPEVMADIVDNNALFDLAFFLRLAGVAGPRGDTERTEELQKGFVEADEGSFPFEHGGEHIVGEDFSWDPVKETKGVQEAAVKGLLVLGVGELEIEQSAVA